jgi:hypothetical protein
MKILALEVECEGSNPQDFSELAQAEAQEVWRLIQAEKIREIYFRRDQDSAVIMLEENSLKDAEGLLQELPFVQAGLIRFELMPLKPYPGLMRLFNNQGLEG